MKKDANAYDSSSIEKKWPSSAKASAGKQKEYNPSEIEKKWQEKWEESKLYSPDINKAPKPFYNLMMFPYPSAEGMHVGNMYAFTGADVYGRFQRMQGNDVFEPIGLDGFGIHAENYALKIGKNPMDQAKVTQENFYRQFRATGNSYDYTRTVETYAEDYYRWTQWLFIQMFKKGLAYRKKAAVNFCPSCKTVLADEQVIDARPPATSPTTSNDWQGVASEVGRGKCERCNSIVEKRDLEQWFFKITDYAERLLNNIPQLDWTEKVKVAQKEWIGKSEGAVIKFKLLVPNQPDVHSVEVFTTRADTLFGATFLVISPELGQKWLSVGWKAPIEVQKYVEKALTEKELDRTREDREKTGVFTEVYAINPVNDEKIPVWVADFVIGSYGTGAVFADAHDLRDFEFAKKYNIPLKPTLKTGDKEKDARIQNLDECFTGDGILVDSGEFTGLNSSEARKKIITSLGAREAGRPQVNYHLRDWLISRQRYWGPPIPMIHCPSCAKASAGKENAGWNPVPEEELPVKLPYIKDYKPLGTGKSPLGNHPEFYRTTCPVCGKEAKRETDVSDTFLDSAWYFFRYSSVDVENAAFDTERVKKWLPVNMYIGGAEHSVLHLLYSRFITMVLKDLGYISFEEPFSQFYSHGLIIKEGAKMSKSKGNVVVPDEYIKKFGADTLRLYLMFIGPFSSGGDFRDSGIEGMNRFVRRVWRLVIEAGEGKEGFGERLEMMHKTIKKVTDDLKKLHYNTAIAALMEWYNFISASGSKINKEEAEVFLKLLAPFAPHFTEELWQQLKVSKVAPARNATHSVAGGKVSQVAKGEGGSKAFDTSGTLDASGTFSSVHTSPWPQFDSKYLEKDEVTVVVQVNGKMRDSIRVKSSELRVRSLVEKLARQSERVKSYLEGKTVRNVIYVEGKIINFVVS